MAKKTKKAKKAKKTEKATKTEKKTRRTFPAPKVGTVLTGTYNGKVFKVKVTKDGIQGKKKLYTSLSNAATLICRKPTHGPTFFGLRGKTGATKPRKNKKAKKAKKARRVKA